jgi:hypothetical protein
MTISDHLDHSDAREPTADELAAIGAETAKLAQLAFAGDSAAALELHRAIYRVLLARHRPPWRQPTADPVDPPIAVFLWTVARHWDRADRDRHRDLIGKLPAPDEYPRWITTLVRDHASGVRHRLFEFLATDADYGQLREFFRQETPLDLYFADLIVCLAPGFYGEPKLEIARNFWDEMGEGDRGRSHRTLRLNMMRRLDIDEDDHATNTDDLVVEELELVNAYFVGAAVRSYAGQLIGMLLATESVAPGRLARQLAGWRRVGLPEDALEYLTVHTVVDVAHGEHWMDNVVRPLIAQAPEAMTDITLGALRRLDIAERICDRMMLHLPALAETGAGGAPEVHAARSQARQVAGKAQLTGMSYGS